MNLLITLFFIPLLLAFTFNPMTQAINLGDGQKAAQFLLENGSEEKLAIELSVKIREMDINGKETLTDTKEISVFPPQLIIPAKEKRTIRVNWNGSKEITLEKSFRVIAEQLPLKVDEKVKRGSGIQILMKFMAAFYVTPGNAKSALNIKEMKLLGDKLQILIENSGNRRQILARPVITINGQDKLTLKSEELKGLAGENVLARSERIFLIKTKLKKLPTGAASIKIDE